MDDGVARYFTRFGCFLINLLTCGRRSLVCETQNDIVVSSMILWGMMKVYWLDLSQLRTKYSSSNCPKHVRRTKSSIKKRIIVHRTVRSMLGEQTLRPVKNVLNRYALTTSLLTGMHGTCYIARGSKKQRTTVRSALRASWRCFCLFVYCFCCCCCCCCCCCFCCSL